MSSILLEDDGGSGTASAHWEKKVFGNELMTGVISGYPVISPITLGLLEDSGWYTVDYTTAGFFTWGKETGCNFITSSCSGFKEFCPKYQRFSCDRSYLFKTYC
jgi:hypothetical protein